MSSCSFCSVLQCSSPHRTRLHCIAPPLPSLRTKERKGGRPVKHPAVSCPLPYYPFLPALPSSKFKSLLVQSTLFLFLSLIFERDACNHSLHCTALHHFPLLSPLASLLFSASLFITSVTCPVQSYPVLFSYSITLSISYSILYPLILSYPIISYHTQSNLLSYHITPYHIIIFHPISYHICPISSLS